jgi:hypothetical protein
LCNPELHPFFDFGVADSNENGTALQSFSGTAAVVLQSQSLAARIAIPLGAEKRDMG